MNTKKNKGKKISLDTADRLFTGFKERLNRIPSYDEFGVDVSLVLLFGSYLRREPQVLEIEPKRDNTLDVSLLGFHNPAKHFTAVKLDQAKAQGLPLPDDPHEHTKMRDWNEPFRFRFPDLSGKLVSNTDEQFRTKP